MEINNSANATSANLGVVGLKRGNFEEAVAAYQATAEAYPDYLMVFQNQILYKQDITVEEAKTILSAYTGWPETEDMQAIVLLDTFGSTSTDTTLNSYLEYYKERLKEEANNYYFLKAVADLYQKMGVYDESLHYYKEACSEAGILSYYATNGLGDAYFYNGQYQEAIACYEQNIEMYQAIDLHRAIADAYLMMTDTTNATAAIETYQAAGGTTKVASYKMMIAYQENDFTALLDYANQCLEETPDDVKVKAYKAVAMKELKLDGVEDIINDIDSISYSAGNSKVMVAESILGRLDRAKEVYGVMQKLYPVNARTAVIDYEIRNLHKDPEFAQMAGVEILWQEATSPVVTEENSSESNAVLPLAVGVGGVVVLGAAAAVMMKKRKEQ